MGISRRTLRTGRGCCRNQAAPPAHARNRCGRFRCAPRAELCHAHVAAERMPAKKYERQTSATTTMIMTTMITSGQLHHIMRPFRRRRPATASSAPCMAVRPRGDRRGDLRATGAMAVACAIPSHCAAHLLRRSSLPQPARFPRSSRRARPLRCGECHYRTTDAGAVLAASRRSEQSGPSCVAGRARKRLRPRTAPSSDLASLRLSIDRRGGPSVERTHTRAASGHRRSRPRSGSYSTPGGAASVVCMTRVSTPSDRRRVGTGQGSSARRAAMRPHLGPLSGPAGADIAQ